VPTDASHAELWYEWRQDSEGKKYNPFAPSPVEVLRQRLSKASSDIALFDRADSFIWLLKAENEVVGNMNIHNINKTMLTAEIGYMIAPKMRGKGFATFSVRHLTQLCFEKTPLRKLIAYVHEDNLPSRRVLEKLGYKAEGLLREHYLIDGAPVNEVIYGILSKDWNGDQNNISSV
jgi:RimJ/RimL family protein N-acetyltransferase